MARYDESELIYRATQAYCTRQRRQGGFVMQPSKYSSHVDEINGRVYTVLENVNGVMAVYRLKNDGRLEYADEARWPDGLVTVYELPPDILEAWAPGQEDSPSIVISREGANNPEPAIENINGDLGPDGAPFDEDAADRLLSASGYRRVGKWSRGMGPQSDRHDVGLGHACEVVKVSENAMSIAA
jgi:hypothetical protein